MVEIHIWPIYLRPELRVFTSEVTMPMSWYGKKMGSAYLLITIGSFLQSWFPNVTWALIPVVALLFGFARDKD